jgi:hypothetical protein
LPTFGGGTLQPLSPLYVGPYEVVERADKFFRLAVGGREETVSIDIEWGEAYLHCPVSTSVHFSLRNECVKVERA